MAHDDLVQTFADIEATLAAGAGVYQEVTETVSEACEAAAKVGVYPPGCPRPSSGSGAAGPAVPAPSTGAGGVGAYQAPQSASGMVAAAISDYAVRFGLGPDDFRALAATDPGAWLRRPGVAFGDLDPKSQRSYMEIQYALAGFGLYSDPPALEGAFLRYREVEQDLGWCVRIADKVCQCGNTLETDCKKTNLIDGKIVPSMISLDEVIEQMQSMAQSWSTTGRAAMTGAGQQAIWSQCLVGDKDKQIACLEQYAGEPGVSQLLRELREPWTTDPAYVAGRTVQSLTGNDGKRYFVFGVGTKEIAIEARFVIGGATAAAFALGGGGYLAIRWLRSPAGKRWRRKIQM